MTALPARSGAEITSIVDGRTARRDRNRDAVIQAIEALAAEGTLPSAAEIAARSGVSERSLFRIFGSREGLFMAAIAAKASEVEHLVQPVAPTGPLDQRLREVVDQRVRFYEAVTPLRRFAEHFAQTSPAVAERLATTRRILRGQLEAAFVPELEVLSRKERSETLAALDASASWETWHHLRVVSGLSIDRARLVYGRTLKLLLQAPGRFRPA